MRREKISDQIGHAETPVFPVHGLVESCPVLNIHRLIASGLLRPGVAFVWGWGEPISDCAQVTVSAQCLSLRYGRVATGEVTALCIPLEYVVAQFGGLRPTLVCPLCNKGFYGLYLFNDTFACQQCHGLRYSRATDESPEQREARKQGRLRRRVLDVAYAAPPGAMVWVVEPGPESSRPNVLAASHEACTALVASTTAGVRTARLEDGLRVREAHPVTAGMVNPATQGNGGRPRVPLSEVPCTCGRGREIEGHAAVCK